MIEYNEQKSGEVLTLESQTSIESNATLVASS